MLDLDFFIFQFNAFFNVQSLLLISGTLNFDETRSDFNEFNEL